MRAVTVRAFAKVNLDLRLERRRPDGYHDIRAVFQSIALHDRVRVEARRDRIEVRCDAPGVPGGPANLAYRAARVLQRRLRRGAARGALITIDKRIPVAGGLGGGSSDAAMTLLALNRLWRLKLDGQTLLACARRLGADVPYFLAGGCALGLGRGDEIYALPDPPRCWLVALVPPFGSATAEVYVRAGRALTARRRPGTMWGSAFSGVPQPCEGLRNDLEWGLGARGRAVGAMKRALVGAGARTALMAGSGSTVFGIFAGRTSAVAARRALGRGRWRAILTHTISRREYHRLIWATTA